MSRRRGSILAVVLVLLAGAGIWLASRDRSPDRRETPAVAPRAEAPESRPPVLVGRGGGAREQAPPKPEPPEEDAGEPPEAPAEGPVRLLLTFAGEGAEPDKVKLHATPDGDAKRAVVVYFGPGERERRLPAAAKYSFTAWIDDWPSAQTLSDLEVSTDGILRLELQLPIITVLEVVAAESGEPLAEAEAAVGGGSLGRLAPDPWVRRNRDRIRGSADGRIRLPPDLDARWYWVVAPGRTWTHVNVPRGSRTIRVELPAGAGILAVVVGWTDPSPPRVVASPERAQPRDAAAPDPEYRDWEEIEHDVELEPDASSPTSLRIDGLPTGRWRLLLSRSVAVNWALPLLVVPVELLPGRLTEVQLTTPRDTAPARVDALLEVEVPPDWASREIRLAVFGATDANGEIRRDYVTPAEPPEGLWRIPLPAVWPGPYGLTFDTDVLEHEWTCFASLTSERAVRVQLPPGGKISVKVLDERGNALERADVGVWYCPTAEEEIERTGAVVDTWSETSDTLESDGTGAYSGRVASGRARLEASAPGYVTESRVVDIAPGAVVTPIEVHLRRAATVEARFVRSGVAFTTAGGKVTCTRVGEGRTWPMSPEDGIVEFFGLEPGEYRVAWRDGERSSEQTVSARPGETTVVLFEVP